MSEKVSLPIELLPCPFCGGSAAVFGSRVAPTLVDVICECGATVFGEQGAEAVIAAWNRRAEDHKQ